jgi:hypothetical protein
MESTIEALSNHYGTSKDFWSSKNNFKIIDTNENEGYNMVHYNNEAVSSTKPEDFLRRVRGLIIKENKVLIESFGYTPTAVVSEIIPDEKDNFIFTDTDLHTHIIHKDSLEKNPIYPLLDGTLIRVWKYKKNIHISTHKKLDAFKSHWGSSETFVELFNKYTCNYFNLEELFDDTNVENDIAVCHNFLLVDKDLLICSQIDMGEKSGFVLYINSINGNFPDVIKPKDVSVYDLKYTTDTFFKIEPLKTLEEQNKFIKYGFYPNINNDKASISSIGEGVVIFHSDRMIKVVSKDYENRSKIVNNDPNIIHRCWTILTESMFPKNGDDDYLSKFPILPTPSKEQLELIIQSEDFNKINECQILGEEKFIGKNNLETRNLRLLNALIHYSKSLPLIHKLSALCCYETILEYKSEVIKILCNEYDKYEQGIWGKPNQRDLKVYERIQNIVKEAKKYAKTRYSNGERIESMSEKQLLKKFTKENIRNLINKEYGENMHKIVRVLITSKNHNISDE